MKTKEFIKRVKELGFDFWITDDRVHVLSNDERTIMAVALDKAFAIDCFYIFNMCLEEGMRKKLFDIAVEYTSTPIKDREEEKKFYVKHKFLVGTEYRDANYLNFGKYDDDKLWLGFKDKRLSVQTQFTLKEIEEIKEKFDTDLADFELVEVEE